MLLVTAYYPLNKSKYSLDVYDQWISLFFECVTCPVMFFCSSEIYEQLKLKARNNVQFVQREFNSFEMMSEPWKSRWERWYTVDPERNWHSPELYAIWAAKQEFVREAIKLKESPYYVWCDVGCFRTRRSGSFEYTANYISPGKITCLDATNLVHDRKPLIGGGVLAGDQEAWYSFSQNYLKELEQNIHGKDQVIYRRVLNDTNALILQPTKKYGDPWFYLTYILTNDNK
jgi:hypothetical protein